MKKVTAIIIGAGDRGCAAYGSYALIHPEELQIVGVAEPNKERREYAAKRFGIPEENIYTDYKDLFARERFADCVLVCTQDRMHYEPTMLAFEKGYHVLCEKPIAVDKKEIVEMVRAAQKHKRILLLGFVLRYSPFFNKLKKMLDAGLIGQLINVQHIENVGYWHQAHSFVRGNWRNSEETCEMIMAKCCHDMDILTWLLGSSCKSVHSFGDLSYFKEENAPEGAPKYCMDGCAHRDECPYYAPYLYLEHPQAKSFARILGENLDAQAVLKELEHGPYGRCVFHCDNNVVDHQIVNMDFENGVNVSFTMTAFSKDCCREINLMGTKGQIRGNMEKGEIVYYDYVTGNQEVVTVHTSDSGHSGSDSAIMRALVQMIVEEEETVKNQNTEQYIDSHFLAFAAEESRINSSVISMQEFKARYDITI